MAFDTRPCPYCDTPCEADWVDVGVGHVQCGPFHCEACGASEIGPCDRYIDSRGSLSGDLRQSLKDSLRWGWRWFVQAQHAHIHARQPFTFERSNNYACSKPRNFAPFRRLTAEEDATGWYAPDSAPGTSANVIGGEIVSHRQALAAYRDHAPETSLEDLREPGLGAAPEATPYAVLCPRHGRVYLTREGYQQQLSRPHAKWACPTCKRVSTFDDATYEAAMEAAF